MIENIKKILFVGNWDFHKYYILKLNVFGNKLPYYLLTII